MHERMTNILKEPVAALLSVTSSFLLPLCRSPNYLNVLEVEKQGHIDLELQSTVNGLGAQLRISTSFDRLQTIYKIIKVIKRNLNPKLLLIPNMM